MITAGTLNEFVRYEDDRRISVNRRGEVMNNYTSKIIKPTETYSGQMRIRFTINKKAYSYSLPKIIAETFIENPHRYLHVIHIDKDVKNNAVENLAWSLKEESAPGKNKSKYVQKKVYMFDLEGNYIKTFKNQAEACRELNLKNNSFIANVLNGKFKSTHGYKFSYQKHLTKQKAVKHRKPLVLID